MENNAAVVSGIRFSEQVQNTLVEIVKKNNRQFDFFTLDGLALKQHPWLCAMKLPITFGNNRYSFLILFGNLSIIFGHYR